MFAFASVIAFISQAMCVGADVVTDLRNLNIKVGITYPEVDDIKQNVIDNVLIMLYTTERKNLPQDM